MATIIEKSDQLGIDISNALGLEPKTVRRIVIDISANAIPTVWVEIYPDEKILDVDWPKRLKAVQVNIGESHKEGIRWQT